MMPIRYTIDLTAEQWLLLVKHGYDPELPPRGVAGGPGRIDGYFIGRAGSKPVFIPLRNHVCELEGVEIDGHEGSDLDPGSTSCLHCDYEGPNP